jgi:Animal haem peroxidase
MEKPNMPRMHGRELRGLSSTPKSAQFEGTFGRMFRTLAAANHTAKDLKALAELMGADEEAPKTAQQKDEPDAEENQSIDAGYTYLGQFIDHDITFDPASSLQKTNDPNALIDYRTPSFDLDNVYGRGPDDQPYLYAPDGMRMLLGRIFTDNVTAKTRDVPRLDPSGTNQPNMPARALIGDPRNDENVIVSQLQAVMLRFHNRMVDIMSEGGQRPTFADVQQQVRWHYQWVVLHDFLPKIVGQKIVNEILPHLGKAKNIHEVPPQLKFYNPKNEAFMPVEFSVAAYRFGHSMVRPFYRLNQNIPHFDIFSMDKNTSLVGFRAFPDNWAIDWNLYFNPPNSLKRPETGIDRIQKSYKIDTSIVNPLKKLSIFLGENAPASLAERNLLRGLSMGLPSGQAVARAMGLTPIADSKLLVGKATAEDMPKNKKITDISKNFAGNAPLWYYVLAEAQQQFKDDNTPIHLGPVGGRIVAEVFIGLLLMDKHSFLSQNSMWTPNSKFLNDGKFYMLDLINEAMKSNDL